MEDKLYGIWSTEQDLRQLRWLVESQNVGEVFIEKVSFKNKVKAVLYTDLKFNILFQKMYFVMFNSTEEKYHDVVLKIGLIELF